MYIFLRVAAHKCLDFATKRPKAVDNFAIPLDLSVAVVWCDMRQICEGTNNFVNKKRYTWTYKYILWILDLVILWYSGFFEMGCLVYLNIVQRFRQRNTREIPRLISYLY